jgi:hypothetical protein
MCIELYSEIELRGKIGLYTGLFLFTGRNLHLFMGAYEGFALLSPIVGLMLDLLEKLGGKNIPTLIVFLLLPPSYF